MVNTSADRPRLRVAGGLSLPSNGKGPRAHQQRRVHLYVVEEQEILRGAYESLFPTEARIDVIGVSGDMTGQALVQAAASLRPNVILVGVKVLQPGVIKQLEAVRTAHPDIAVVLLSAVCEAPGLKALREFVRGTSRGWAYLLKHTVETANQLAQVIRAVAEGRVILDPAVMEGLIATAGPQTSRLRELSPRELEVLGLMAKGYRNGAIAKLLSLESKTVGRHINSIYTKLGHGDDSKHPRVFAVTLYMRATGQLPDDDAEAA